MTSLKIPSLKGKKILITGGLGFIGSNLARRLTQDGANVTLLDLPGKKLDKILDIKDKVTIVTNDLSNQDQLTTFVTHKDVIYHLAWQTDLKQSMEHPQRDLTRDGIGTLNLLEACRHHNPHAKIIFPSTTTVVGFPEHLPANEEEPERPYAIYEAHKLLVEKYLHVYHHAYQMNTTVLRLSNVFGEGQSIDNPNRGVLNYMVGRALRGEPLTIYGDGEFTRDYGYVQNYVDAFILAATTPKTNGETYVLGSGRGVTFNEAMQLIVTFMKEIAKKNVTITHIPFPEGENKINKRNFIADYSKFTRATGWKPRVPFEEALKTTIQYYHDQHHH